MRRHGLSDPFNSWDALKILALLLMFIDHTGVFFLPEDQWIRGIGRGAAPIFLFLAGRACSYRFNWEIFLLATLLTLSDTLLAGHLREQNILFAILICRSIFYWLDKRGKKIERLHEWYIGSLALFMSMVFIQYGSIGFLFALCGYLQAHPADYSQAQSRRFLQLSFVTYAVLTAVLSKFTLTSDLCMTLSLLPVYRLLERFEVRNIAMPLPRAITRLGKIISYYSGYIYAAHLILLEWLTGIPF